MGESETARWAPALDEAGELIVKEYGRLATKCQPRCFLRATVAVNSAVKKFKILKLITWSLYLICCLLALLAVAFAALQFIVEGADIAFLRWFAVLLPSFLCVGQEVMIWKSRKASEGGEPKVVGNEIEVVGNDIEMRENTIHIKK